MSYALSSHGGWTNTGPQTGESAFGSAKTLMLNVSATSDAMRRSWANQQTSIYTLIFKFEDGSDSAPESTTRITSHAFDAVHVTDRIKNVFGLSISRQAQILGVSRTALYNWRKGESPTEKHLARLSDLNNAADLFEQAGIEVTGLLMKRPFHQGKSLLDLLTAGDLICAHANVLIEQIKREAEERSALANRFHGRAYPRFDADSDWE